MIGPTEEELKTQKREYKVGKSMFRANGRAKTLGEIDGMIKVLSDTNTDRLLGVHIVGPRASDLIAEVAIAMEFSASTEDLVRTCHAHPTLSEALREAAMAVDKRAIHG